MTNGASKSYRVFTPAPPETSQDTLSEIIRALMCLLPNLSSLHCPAYDTSSPWDPIKHEIPITRWIDFDQLDHLDPFTSHFITLVTTNPLNNLKRVSIHCAFKDEHDYWSYFTLPALHQSSLSQVRMEPFIPLYPEDYARCWTSAPSSSLKILELPIVGSGWSSIKKPPFEQEARFTEVLKACPELEVFRVTYDNGSPLPHRFRSTIRQHATQLKEIICERLNYEGESWYFEHSEDENSESDSNDGAEDEESSEDEDGADEDGADEDGTDEDMEYDDEDYAEMLHEGIGYGDRMYELSEDEDGD